MDKQIKAAELPVLGEWCRRVKSKVITVGWDTGRGLKQEVGCGET